MTLLMLPLVIILNWFRPQVQPLSSTELRHALEVVSPANRSYSGMQDCMEREVFRAAWAAKMRYCPDASMLAIADFTQPSAMQRFYLVDLKANRLILQSWVAHGRNSGDDVALRFSNENASNMSSCGTFRIGEPIISPKHGPAFLLEGLEKGVNDNARMREIIIHGADYVKEEFIEAHGRCGRSLGCPALAPEVMQKVNLVLRPGSILYIHR